MTCHIAVCLAERKRKLWPGSLPRDAIQRTCTRVHQFHEGLTQATEKCNSRSSSPSLPFHHSTMMNMSINPASETDSILGLGRLLDVHHLRRLPWYELRRSLTGGSSQTFVWDKTGLLLLWHTGRAGCARMDNCTTSHCRRVS